jgi:hypothetical protein
VYFTSTDTGYVTGLSGYIYKTTNGGSNWSQQGNGASGSLNFNSVQFISADTGFIVGENSSFLKTIDGGTNWTSTYGGGIVLRSVYFLDANTGYAAGDYAGTGIIQKTTNGGTNWTVQFSGGTTQYSLCFPNSTIGYSVGSAGAIRKTTITTEITNDDDSTSIAIFPNPNNGIFSVFFKNTDLKAEIEIYNVLGEKIYSTLNFNQQNENRIDLSNFSRGIYMAKVHCGMKFYTKKIVVQ